MALTQKADYACKNIHPKSSCIDCIHSDRLVYTCVDESRPDYGRHFRRHLLRKQTMRTQRCILVGGEKGGTGKSTIATNLARTHVKLAGFDTHLVDCDKQLTSLKFATRRHGPGDCLQPLSVRMWPAINSTYRLLTWPRKYDAVIIDCGGQDSVELRSAMIAPCVESDAHPRASRLF